MPGRWRFMFMDVFVHEFKDLAPPEPAQTKAVEPKKTEPKKTKEKKK